jgi:hypothetical protein
LLTYGGLLQSIFRLFIAFALTAFVSTSFVAIPASAATRAATSAAVSLSATSIAPNQSVIVRGTLKRGTAAFAGARVALQVRLTGSTTWSLLKSAVTNSTGQISTTVWPSRNHQFRLVFTGWSSAYPASSPVRDLYVRQSATVTKASSASVDAGDTVSLSGTTSAALAGRPATLQIKSGTTWKSLVGGKVSSTKTFSLSTKATGRGNQYYRVVVSGTSSASGAITATKTFTVYAWYSLDTVVPWYSPTLVPQANWRIAGTTYPQVLGAFDTTRYSDRAVTYGQQCRTLRANIGMMDRSEVGVYFGARTDSRSVASEVDFGFMAPGQAPKQVSMNLTGSDWLLVYTAGSSYNGRGAYPAYIGARISCTTTPGYFVL